MTAKIEYREDKLRELILYIADRMESSRWFGATMLNKVLYYADFTHYRDTGNAITGADYMHLERGPAPRRMKPLMEDLQSEGAIRVEHRSAGAYTQKRPVALRPANTSLFSEEELERVRDVIDFVSHYTATSISELTHIAVGWQATREKETIPYTSVWLKREMLNDSDIARAHELANA